MSAQAEEEANKEANWTIVGRPQRCCAYCAKDFVPSSGANIYCTKACRESNAARNTPKTAGKRPASTSSPGSSDLLAKKAKLAEQVGDVASDSELAGLSSLDKEALTARLSKCLGLLREQDGLIRSMGSMLAQHERDLVRVKLALADKTLSALALGCPSGTSYAAVAARPGPSPVLVASVKSDAALQGPLTAARMDHFLNTGPNRAVPQLVRHRGDEVRMTFANSTELEKAKAALEQQPECKKVFQSVSKTEHQFPAVALFVDTADLKGFESELQLRNPSKKGQIISIRPVHVKPGGTVGHVRLALRSRAIRDELIAKGRIYTGDRFHRVVPVDLDREVLRCFRCQKYGHKQGAPCKAERPSCGKCAGGHLTRECSASPPPPPKCANCKGAHHAGDRQCPDQKAAVSRYRAVLGEQ